MDLNNRHPLRLNVGFLLHQGVGTYRSFEFNHAHVRLAADLAVSDLKGSVRMSRTAQGLYADGRLGAHATVECVRCLEPFEQDLDVEVHDLFVYPPSQATDPLLTIPETGILDLNPLLREYLLLDVPLRPLCRPDCKGLCPICGKDLNTGPCEHPAVEIDPRLSALRTLLTGPDDGDRAA